MKAATEIKQGVTAIHALTLGERAHSRNAPPQRDLSWGDIERLRRSGEVCARCDTRLDDIIYLGETYPHRLIPLCGDCFAPPGATGYDERIGSEPFPCENCGRLVVRQVSWSDLTPMYTTQRIAPHCCLRCQGAANARKRRARRRAVRPARKCETCAMDFVPTRTDARHCSNACRQKAYRRRKD